MIVLTKNEMQKYRNLFSETDEDLSGMFKALGDLHRYRIFLLVMRVPHVSIGSIATILNISTSLTSQHVKVLVHARLLQKQRNGKKIFPKINPLNPLLPFLKKTLQYPLTYKRRVKRLLFPTRAKLS